MDDTRDQYYLNLHVEDRPGALAEIADRFGRTASRSSASGRRAPATRPRSSFITHRAQEGAFQKTLHELRELDAVHAVASLLRVEGEE